jgi:hypothetical protein
LLAEVGVLSIDVREIMAMQMHIITLQLGVPITVQMSVQTLHCVPHTFSVCI